MCIVQSSLCVNVRVYTTILYYARVIWNFDHQVFDFLTVQRIMVSFSSIYLSEKLSKKYNILKYEIIYRKYFINFKKLKEEISEFLR